MKNEVIGPFFFAEATMTGQTYLDMLVNFVFLQIKTPTPKPTLPAGWSTITGIWKSGTH